MRVSGKDCHYATLFAYHDRTICGEREHDFYIVHTTKDVRDVTCERCLDAINRTLAETFEEKS